MAMGTIRNYKDLIAWQKDMDLVEQVYRPTRGFPATERFSLTAQSRRAAVSVPANVAEGFGRCTRTDYIRFLDMASGSANEVETHLLIAQRLGFVEADELDAALGLACEVQRIMRGLTNSLRKADRTTVRSERKR